MSWMAQELWFSSQRVQEMFLHFKMSIPAMHPPINLFGVYGGLFPMLKQLEHEADYSSLSSVEVKNE